MSDALIQRWDAFLDKIRTQFDAIMTEAKTGCLALLDLNKLDPIAMTNAWSGVRAEAMALSRRIDTMWDEKVETTLRSGGMSDRAVEEQRLRGAAARDRLDRDIEVTEIDVFAAAGDRILEAAKAQYSKAFPCTQCGAALPNLQHIFRAIHVTCTYCNRVNTYEPGMTVRMVEHFCGHHLSQRAAIEEWHAMQDAQTARRKSHGDRIEILKAMEVATERYWSAYFTARAMIIPELRPDIPRDVESRMKAFYDDMSRSPVWVAHARSG